MAFSAGTPTFAKHDALLLSLPWLASSRLTRANLAGAVAAASSVDEVLAIGCPRAREGIGGGAGGGVLVYALTHTTMGQEWTLSAEISSSDVGIATNGDSFGSSVAMSGNTLVISCPDCLASSSSTTTGLVMIFARHVSTPPASYEAGWASGASSTPSSSSMSSEKDGVGWGLVRKLTAESSVVGGSVFGRCISLEGSLLLVATSPPASAALPATAAAHLYLRYSAGQLEGGHEQWWGLQASLSVNTTFSRFGTACGISGGSVVVTDPGRKVWTGGEWQTRGMVYEWRIAPSSSSTPSGQAQTKPISLHGPYPHAPWQTLNAFADSQAGWADPGDEMGAAVSADAVWSMGGGAGRGREGGGEVVIVGAPNAWLGERQGGAARVLMRRVSPDRDWGGGGGAWSMVEGGLLLPNALNACPDRLSFMYFHRMCCVRACIRACAPVPKTTAIQLWQRVALPGTHALWGSGRTLDHHYVFFKRRFPCTPRLLCRRAGRQGLHCL